MDRRALTVLVTLLADLALLVPAPGVLGFAHVCNHHELDDLDRHPHEHLQVCHTLQGRCVAGEWRWTMVRMLLVPESCVNGQRICAATVTLAAQDPFEPGSGLTIDETYDLDC